MERQKRCCCQKTPFHHSPTFPFPTSVMFVVPQAVMVAAFRSRVGLSCLMNSSYASLYEFWSAVCVFVLLYICCFFSVLVFFLSYICSCAMSILVWVSVQRYSFCVQFFVFVFHFLFESKRVLLCIYTI